MRLPLFLVRFLIRSGLARFVPGMLRWSDGNADFLHYYSERILTAPRGELREASLLVEPPAPDVIDLSRGTPRFDVPTSAPRLTGDRRALPPLEGLPELRTAVSDWLLTEHQLAVSPSDEVFITAGASGALDAVLDAFTNPGDSVALFDPTSPLFVLALRVRQLRPRWIPCQVEEGRLRFPMDALDRALRLCKLLLLAQPSNPTGGVLAPEDLDQIAYRAARHDVLVCSDESFARFHYEGSRVSPGTLPQARKRTLTLGSLSKSHALASLRVGWVAGHRCLVRPCLLTAAMRAEFVPSVCQQIAAAALRQSVGVFAPVLAEYGLRRRYAFERLQAMGLRPGWPASGYFFWAPVVRTGMTGRAFAERLLRERRVQVTPGHLFGPSGRDWVRISCAVEEGRLREGLLRMEDLLTGRATAEPLFPRLAA